MTLNPRVDKMGRLANIDRKERGVEKVARANAIAPDSTYGTPSLLADLVEWVGRNQINRNGRPQGIGKVGEPSESPPAP